MRLFVRIGLSVVMLSAVAGMASAQLLPPASDDIKLQVAKQEFDEDAAGRSESSHTELVATYFKVDRRLIEALRSAKETWGEVVVRLVLAQELAKTHPDRYANPAQAMPKIGELRRARRSWTEVAAQLDMNLSPAINEAQRIRKELRASTKSTGSK